MAVTLSVITALGLSMTGGTGVSSLPSVAGGASAPDSTAPDTRFVLVANSEESAAATAKRLSEALDAAFRKEAPGAKWIFEPSGPHETGPDGQPPKLLYKGAKDAPKSLEMFAGDGGVLNRGRKGHLHLGIFPGKGVSDDPANQDGSVTCSPTAQECKEGTAPNGAKTTLLTISDDGGVGEYVAAVGLPDGRILKIANTKAFGVEGAGAAQDGPPLTSDQVMGIAINVASQIKA
ncbi:hypothetical protein ACFPIJ_54300 [Dactylosporangium cerinum]|uniref:Uncharacterized protein n=1 Tax=Dactylosporangium cerinum TaxID=1434730 RepID=A0ABV9WEW7_9ACTN